MSHTAENPSDNRQNLPTAATSEHPIVFFDGVCGLCNRLVNFILARDPQGIFRFAPLQGETARTMLPDADTASLGTLVLAAEDGLYRRSTAVVRILQRLGPGWRLSSRLLWAIPRPLRDAGYQAVAKTRYRLFGKHETCRLPTPEERERFLP